MSSFSIWLLLEKESRSNYRQIVKTISKRLKAPIFEPHCTIYGHFNTDIEILKPIVTELAKNYNQFSASVKKIKSGDSYSKSLYVSIKNSGALNQLNKICKNKFSRLKKYGFDPHISIAYGIYSKEEIYVATKSLIIPSHVVFNGLSIVKTDKNVKSWETVFQRQF
jgi:2'-5' RNA ligase